VRRNIDPNINQKIADMAPKQLNWKFQENIDLDQNRHRAVALLC
jgi:hypothetical protein